MRKLPSICKCAASAGVLPISPFATWPPSRQLLLCCVELNATAGLMHDGALQLILAHFGTPGDLQLARFLAQLLDRGFIAHVIAARGHAVGKAVARRLRVRCAAVSLRYPA